MDPGYFGTIQYALCIDKVGGMCGYNYLAIFCIFSK